MLPICGNNCTLSGPQIVLEYEGSTTRGNKVSDVAGLPTVNAVIRTEQKSAQYRGLKNPADSFQAHTEPWDTK